MKTLRYTMLILLALVTIFQWCIGGKEYSMMAGFCTVVYGVWVLLNHDNENNDFENFKLT